VSESRLNKVIDKLTHGEVVVSSGPVPNGSFDLAELYGESDFDMVWFEMEHFGFDFLGLRISLQALLNRRRIVDDGVGPSVVPFARIPPNAREGNQWVIKQALDTGLYGFIAPVLETPEQALAIVNAARYPTQRDRAELGGGQRGYWPRLCSRYWGVSQQEYVQRADVWPTNPDGEILIIGIVETRLGVENLERILDATNGIGAIWPGHGDLSSDMGLIGQAHHPEVEEQLQRVQAVCKARGVACVASTTSAAEATRRVAEGCRIIFAPLERGIATTIRNAAAGR
jgi:4-hydroxy-2-oxoheptanedioate aldolase